MPKQNKKRYIKKAWLDNHKPPDKRKTIASPTSKFGSAITGNRSFRDHNDLEALGIMVQG